MLRASNLVPTISAHSYLYGVHDYNRMPLAPLVCTTQCFEDPNDRTSWGPNAIGSWYIGTSNKHYRCYEVFARQTRSVRTTDMIKFKHKWIISPSVQAADAVVAAAERLTATLQDNIPDSLGETSIEELECLADIFHQAALKLSNEEAEREHVRHPRVTADTTNGRTPTTLTVENQQPQAAVPRVNCLVIISQDEDEEPPQSTTEGGGKCAQPTEPRYNT